MTVTSLPRDGAAVGTFALELDPDHPTPLYHQIAQAIRWKIGTGDLPPGRLLPSLRDASERWAVSYHTVRRAYGELADDGVVESVRGDGTRVLRAPPRARTPSVRAFVREVVEEARRRFGLGPRELGALVSQRAAHDEAGPRAATVVECNDHQCADLAEQLEGAGGVAAKSWNLGRRGEPPPGPMVGTWFHYAEMRRRWPHRIPDMVFAALRLDPEVTRIVTERLVRSRARRVVLCEADVGTAQQHAADLVSSLTFPIDLAVSTTLPEPSDIGRGGLYVVAPRLWDDLSPTLRDHPRVVELRHVFEPKDLQTIMATLVP